MIFEVQWVQKGTCYIEANSESEANEKFERADEDEMFECSRKNDIEWDSAEPSFEIGIENSVYTGSVKTL